jgi:hypothetical protein
LPLSFHVLAGVFFRGVKRAYAYFQAVVIRRNDFLQLEISEHPPAAADPLRAPQPLSISVMISETQESTLDC